MRVNGYQSQTITEHDPKHDDGNQHQSKKADLLRRYRKNITYKIFIIFGEAAAWPPPDLRRRMRTGLPSGMKKK